MLQTNGASGGSGDRTRRNRGGKALTSILRKFLDDDIFEMANGLSFRMLLAFFPFMVFFMTLVGFMNLDETEILSQLYGMLPDDINELIRRFLAEVVHARSRALLSTSLFFSVYNTANGFRAIIRSINRAYGYRDERNFFHRTGISLLLMLIFTMSIIVMLALVIFGEEIQIWLMPLMPRFLEPLYSLFGAFVSMLVLAAATTIIYKLACARKVRIFDVLPGAVVTVVLWVVASTVFSYFITNYSSYTTVYGSVAGVFILVIWLNLISLILLIGNEINSMLMVEG